ncbi:protein of unknown function [Burkholderia multivorans]
MRAALRSGAGRPGPSRKRASQSHGEPGAVIVRYHSRTAVSPVSDPDVYTPNRIHMKHFNVRGVAR